MARYRKCKVQKLLGTPLTTSLGHLDQERTNLTSTKQHVKYEGVFPGKISKKTTDYFYAIMDIPTKSTTSTDQIGQFPCQSSKGNN